MNCHTSMQEYYIRKEGDEDSRGPFTLEQLSSLVEAGQVDRGTLFYDATAEKWVEVQSNAELIATLFPVKRKLTIRRKDAVRTLNITNAEDSKPITVEQMLAEADGRTKETRDKRDLTRIEAGAALWGMRAMGVILLVSAAGLLVSKMDVISSFQLIPMLTSPFIVLGVIDLLLALLLFLEVTAVYDLVRIRASIGVGFFLVYFGSVGEWKPFAGAAVGAVCLFILTRLFNIWKVGFFTILGLAGTGWFTYTLLH